jgi:hypothetical protein
LSDPATLGKAIRLGILDAPHLKGSHIAKGAMKTKIIDGACDAVDPKTEEPISEQKRIEGILDSLSG